MSTCWLPATQPPFCAVCVEYRVESAARYTCPACADPVYEGRRAPAPPPVASPLPSQRTPGWPWRIPAGGAA